MCDVRQEFVVNCTALRAQGGEEGSMDIDGRDGWWGGG